MRTRSLWIEGLTDAVAFVVGGLVGYGVGRLLGLDIFAPGYGLDAMGGIVLVGLGAGLGRRVMRGALARRDDSDAAG
jgi:hypothetical protein